MKTYQDHEEAIKVMHKHNTSHIDISQKVVVRCGNKFILMPWLHAIISHVEYEYDGF